jgi:NAD(P)-dependent dehydrogenase (short-subunit alcohol dehydrogenase family)
MLAQALYSKRIVVNSICPGWVQTDMGGSSAPRILMSVYKNSDFQPNKKNERTANRRNW